ncbi:uncharacterized protein LOC110845068 [Folsomia candida]|uniref:uncharacterized protein LOC110845068 n=1 Tax=Folsomia candida TaxID=158441 RepID=UPI001604BB90|nr:uncharacterized protein LOC110845068 [Folsomia candida]
MGNLITKPGLPNQPPLRQLQHKVLRYIYHDHSDNQDPREILKSYQKSGHVAVSLEHFLENIPHDIWKQYNESEDKNKYRMAEIGSRFVVHNDEGVRMLGGKCIGIQIRIQPDVKSSSPEIFIELKLDNSTNSTLSQPLVKTYNINELSLEKIYLQKFLKSNEPLEKSENLNPSLETKLHSPPSETSKKKKPIPLKVTNQNATLESDNITIPDSVKLYSVPSTLLNNTSPGYQILKRSFTKKTNTNKANSQPRYGENKGIHGANNSCYMDSILFSIFYTTQEFDPVFIARKEQDSDDAAELRQIVSDNVVIPLRTDLYVASSNLADLRKFLSKFDDRFSGAMMDIEELLYLLLEDILMEPHFLQYNNGTKDFIHQILTDDDEECSKKAGEVITLQSVLENSFKLWGDLKLLQRPNPAFLIQFPRSDGDMIHFDGILPNKFLNFGGILDKKPCSFCLAVDCGDFWECRTCRNNELQSQWQYYCEQCMNTSFQAVLEQHETQHGHRPQLINGNKMKLHAIICIKSAHYTSIVKCEDGFGKNNCDWFYFDSMSGSGPGVTLLHDFESKLTKAEASILNKSSFSTHDQFVLKAMNDCHICIYLPINWTE